MLLSKPQKKILELLRIYGGLPKPLLAELCGDKENINIMLNQLANFRKVKLQNDIATSGMPYNRNMAEALRIMVLSDIESVQCYQPGAPPFTLTFFKLREDKLWRYDICHVAQGYETLISSQLSGISGQYRKIIFAVDTLKNQKKIMAPCEICFAERNGNDIKFYE